MNVNKEVKNFLLLFKIVLFVFIITSPVINFKHLALFDLVYVKMLLLAVIIGFAFIDFQLALIATIAFMILVINLNNNILMSVKDNFQENFQYTPLKARGNAPDDSDLDRQFQLPATVPKEIDQTQNIVCTNPVRRDMNTSLFGMYIDEKIKPYEVFIQMMTDEDKLRSIQGL